MSNQVQITFPADPADDEAVIGFADGDYVVFSENGSNVESTDVIAGSPQTTVQVSTIGDIATIVAVALSAGPELVVAYDTSNDVQFQTRTGGSYSAPAAIASAEKTTSAAGIPLAGGGAFFTFIFPDNRVYWTEYGGGVFSALSAVYSGGSDGTDTTVDAAALSNGNVIVTWNAESSGASTLYGAILTQGSSSFSTPITLGSATLDPVDPGVASLTGGGFAVVWVSGVNPSDIETQVFDSSGTAVSSLTLVDTHPNASTEENPEIVGLNDGGYLVVWDGARASGDGAQDIYGQQYDASGHAVGSNFVINQDSDSGHFLTTDGHNSVALLPVSGASEVVVSWRDSSFTIYARELTIDGPPTGANESATLGQDKTFTFATTDFSFSDPNGDSFAGIVVTSLPTVGTLTDNGMAVAQGALISSSDIAGGLVQFTSDYATPGSTNSFSFEVEDSGSRADGSANTSVASYTYTFAGQVINDTAAAIGAEFDALNSNSAITEIIVSDNAAVPISVAQLSSDTTAIGLLQNANNSPYQLAISGTATNIENALTTIESDLTHIASVTLTSGTASVPVTQFNADQGALDKIVDGFAISDTAAAIGGALDALNAGANITAIAISDNAAVSISVAQLTSDATALGKLANANASAYQLAVSDTAAHVVTGLATIEADLSHIASVTLTSGTVSISVTQFNADQGVLDKIAGGFAVSDTAAAIGSALNALNSDTHITAITVSNNAVVAVSVAQLTSDATALGKLANANASAYQLAVSDTAANLSTAIDALEANGHIISITLTGGGALSLTAAQVVNDATALGKITGPYQVAIVDTAADIAAEQPAINAFIATGHVTSVSTSNATLGVASGIALTVIGNANTINLQASATLHLSGNSDTVNGSNGSVYLTSAQATVTGSGETIYFTGGSNDAVNLLGTKEKVIGSGGVISGFAAGDTIDLGSVAYAVGDQFVFQSTTSGVQTWALESAGNSVLAELNFTGQYAAADFTTRPDGSTGTLIGFSPPREDLNGGGTSDILFSSAGHNLVDWITQDGTYQSANTIGNASSYKAVGVGDFNADRTSDILLQNSSGGDLIDWMMQNGHYQSYNGIGNPSTSGYGVVGTGDVNGDGTTDILLQNGPGNLIDWIMKNGVYQSYNNIGNPAAGGYGVVGTGDFNGDGTTDVLLENGSGNLIDWIMQNGVYQSYNNIGNAGASGYGVVGTGDMNGDGITDILLENGSGNLIDWIMQNGAYHGYNEIGNTSGYSVVGTGDYNGNATADVLLQNAAGNMIDWTITNGAYSGWHEVGNPQAQGLSTIKTV